MELVTVLQAKVYDLNDEEKVPIIKSSFGLTTAEKDKCKSSTGLFNVLKEKFRPGHNENILLLQ